MTSDPRLSPRRRPAFSLPPDTCDAHCHVFGPGDRFPYAPGRTYTPEDAPKEALRALHDQLGIERAVIVQASCHGTDNAAMLDCLASDPRRYRGVAIVDEGFSDVQYRAMHDAGVRGVRFNFMPHLGASADLRVVDRVVDRIADMGWHVVLHLHPTVIIPLSAWIQELPVRFVIDHMGRVPASDGVTQPPFRALLELLGNERCWVKVCGSERISMPPYTQAIPIAAALVSTGGDRLLWGTDFPHPNASHEADEATLVELIPKFAPDAAVRRQILVDNPARLYDFS
jgi:predicted TIM-barrel fold metal-dependent hydrolase